MNRKLKLAILTLLGFFQACSTVKNPRTAVAPTATDWEVWLNRFKPFRDREWAHTGICACCNVWRYCQGGGAPA